MKKILVPCDFSRQAINAYRFALDIASQSKGTVHLLHVLELPVLYDTTLMPVLNFEAELLDDLKDNAITKFQKLTEKYKTEGVKAITSVQFGSVSLMIQDYITVLEIDLVVMGSQGASGARELFIGSNAEKVVRYSPVPVLVLKDYYKGPVKNIVFPTSIDIEDEQELISKVKALQNFFKATIHIVWINTPLNFSSDTTSRDMLVNFARRYALKDYTINIFNHQEEEHGILEFTRYVKGDLIAMGTHSRKGISHLVNGSLAEDIVNHTKGLVWTYSLKNELVEK
jgi:nucleotide-binding universal stress UspA family protein